MEECGPYNAPAPRCQLAIIYYFGVAFVSTEKRMAKGGENGKGVKNKQERKEKTLVERGVTTNTHASDFLLLWQPPHGHTLLSIYIYLHTHKHTDICVESTQRNI